MTIIIEINGPFQWRFGYFKSSIMFRFWWAFFAIGFTKKNLRELSEQTVFIRT